MRRYFGITITVIIVIVVIIAIGVAGKLEFDRPSENEFAPNRSSYNSGPTGTRALYQLLEESGMPVARWRENYSSLNAEAKDALLVIVGPFPSRLKLTDEEVAALEEWVSSGGQALVISRSPIEQFGHLAPRSEPPDDFPDFRSPPERFIYEKSDELIAQPTELTRNVRGLALSGFASRMKVHPPEAVEKAEKPESTEKGKAGEPAGPGATKDPAQPEADPGASKDKGEEYLKETLYDPVIHLSDRDGAALADYTYGEGRVIFLSDPFVIANNGIARGANLTLTLNILRSMGAPNRKIFFDEFHHGYQSESNPLVNYFRGTPAPWLLLQGLGLSLLILYTYGRRFARPMPLPQIDRHSPLEFVGSMANLQQMAQARELALENIYPRFKANLCRRLGLSSRAPKDEIIAGVRRRRFPISEIELRQTLSDAELTLSGEQIDDARLVALVARMRRIISHTVPRA
ncbi:MAG TPA: DUF4350 domain-containing protein [Blastocatellia bacterium]|nr:DUF4350 domain-containing protein [Blastocatellia bacterium]